MDLNSDGHIDILSGSYSRMGSPMAGLLQVLYGNADGTFKKAVELKGTDNKPLVIPPGEEQGDTDSICTRPYAVDWDGDGDLDLVVGNFSGGFHLFTGEGGGKFAPKPTVMMAGGKPLKVKGHHGDPFVIDWDVDGDLDILSGSAQGGVQWAENTAGPKKAPELKRFAWVIKADDEPVSECRPNEVKTPFASTRVWVADVNGDKKLDILVGDSIDLISPAEGLSEDKFVAAYDEWKKQQDKLIKSLTDASDEKKQGDIQEKMHAHYEKREKFMSEDRTGFVWVYLQK